MYEEQAFTCCLNGGLRAPIWIKRAVNKIICSSSLCYLEVLSHKNCVHHRQLVSSLSLLNRGLTAPNCIFHFNCRPAEVLLDSRLTEIKATNGHLEFVFELVHMQQSWIQKATSHQYTTIESVS